MRSLAECALSTAGGAALVTPTLLGNVAASLKLPGQYESLGAELTG